MKNVNAIFTFLLFVCPNVTMAQQDSTAVNNDSITWNKELDGVVVKAQRQRRSGGQVIDLFFEPIGMWKSKGFNIPISSQWG